jgi:hypothetical protein
MREAGKRESGISPNESVVFRFKPVAEKMMHASPLRVRK